jgi:hypothetical protein
MAAVLSRGAVSTGRFLRHEFDETWPVFVFFLIGFLLLFVLIKLVLARFSIEVSAASNAIVGALFAAKAAMLLNETPLARSLGNYRRIVAVAVKTFIYGLAVLLLGYLERILEALHKVHSFGGAIEYVASHANHDIRLAWALGISIIFALYFAFFEINQRLGDGELRSLFFDTPGIARGSALSPGVTGNRRHP